MRRTPLLLVAFAFASTALAGCSFIKRFDDFTAGCPGGTADCDPLVDGCETDSDNGRANCGACGVQCDVTDLCGEGSCQQYRTNLAMPAVVANGASAPPRVVSNATGGLFAAYRHNAQLTVAGLNIPATSTESTLLRLNAAGAVNFSLGMNGMGSDRIVDMTATSFGVVAACVFDGASTSLSATSGSPTVVNNAAAGTDDSVLWALDNNGTFRWSLRASGAANTSISAVTTDGSGNVYAAGSFAGSQLFLGTSSNLAGSLTAGIFVVKLLSNGARAWTTVLDAPSALISTIAADREGNVYLFSTSSGTVTLAGNTNVGNSTPRIVALDGTDGSVSWFQGYSGAEPSFDAGKSIVVVPGASPAQDRLFVAFYSSNPSSALGTIPISQGSILAEIDRASGDPLQAYVVSSSMFPYGLGTYGTGEAATLVMSNYITSTAATSLAIRGVDVPFTFQGGSYDSMIVGVSTDGVYRFAKTVSSTGLDLTADFSVSPSGVILASMYLNDPLMLDGTTYTPFGSFGNSIVLRMASVDVPPLP